jgi:hypothetical protein
MDAELNDQVTALLRTAGFTEIARMRGDTFLMVSAMKGTTRAVFHATSDATVGGAGRGGPYKDTPQIEAAMVPSLPDMAQALLDDPELAKATGLSGDKLAVLRPPPANRQ